MSSIESRIIESKESDALRHSRSCVSMVILPLCIALCMALLAAPTADARLRQHRRPTPVATPGTATDDRGDALRGLFALTAGPSPPAVSGASVALMGSPTGAVRDPLDDEFDALFDTESDIFPDHLEFLSRPILGFNQALDFVLLDPLTRGYRLAVPSPARRALVRLFANLNAPPILINKGLQREWKGAGITVTRFLVNSTLGIGGLFDPAAAMQLPPQHSDFGQTLALAGVGSGGYLVLPIVGPTTVRDGFGALVDTLLRPTTYLLPATVAVYAIGGRGFSLRAQSFEQLKALEASSIDYYTALRSAYSQNRAAQIWGADGRAAPPPSAVSAVVTRPRGRAPLRVERTRRPVRTVRVAIR